MHLQPALDILASVNCPLYGVDGYEAGLYSTPAGPLHVSVGIGTFFLPIRFGCRPELAVLEI